MLGGYIVQSFSGHLEICLVWELDILKVKIISILMYGASH